jgi:Family of unknown function (DUF5682)
MSDVSPLLLGVRHHGPGSARAVRRALEAYQPEIVLIEGPPEADDLVALASSSTMEPPVALLAYPAAGGAARSAAFWPFAEFSPEWQALRWALAHSVPVRFMDLAVTHVLAREQGIHDDETHHDPLGALAAAGGYDDPERWWEDVVEHRLSGSAQEAFEAVAAAMAEVRAGATSSTVEQQREASMRIALRAARKQYARVAVVCGAWHVPALTAPLPAASADAAVLRGLPKTKVAMTWVPWTHGRLASWQGYGAGVRSPGWYHHLFTSPDHPVTRWLVDVAALLRREGQPVSSAHVIEGVRLAETLAGLRGRPLAGLAEVTEATLSVLCDGDDVRLRLVDRQLVVGERLGRVPDETPSVPLARDVAAAQRRLRMQPSALVSNTDLDLRKEFDLARSLLLHRLRLLGVQWGTPVEVQGTGTFKEGWQLRWAPEFAVDLIEASAYGTSVVAAATAKAVERAGAATALAEVTELLAQCLLADLPDALPVVLQALSDRVALDADVLHLMLALPALARTLRYGDVRGTDTSAVRTVTHGLVVRVCVGLGPAMTALDDDAAAQMMAAIGGVDAALILVADEALRDEWLSTLERLSLRDDLHGVLAGRMTRLLLDGARLETAEVGRRMGLVLTVGVPAPQAAAWVEGFLAGGGLLLVHDDRLLGLVDEWLAGIPTDGFVEVLPLLRRTFATFAGPERRAIGERVRHRSGGTGSTSASEDDVDVARGALVVPTLRLLLGRAVLEEVQSGE